MWVKVCGIRDVQTAEAIAKLHVNAIGLNFYIPSPRCVDVETAMQISAILPAEVARVGVFVNHSTEEIVSITEKCRLNYVQLHGDETPAYVAELKQRIPGVGLIRAYRIDQSGLLGLRSYLSECEAAGCHFVACLVDAHAPGVYGGSGVTVPWEMLASEYERDRWPQLILAGGLKPANVAEAIAAVKPWGVDVASGVESSPGVKDLELVEKFVWAARQD